MKKGFTNFILMTILVGIIGTTGIMLLERWLGVFTLYGAALIVTIAGIYAGYKSIWSINK